MSIQSFMKISSLRTLWVIPSDYELSLALLVSARGVSMMKNSGATGGIRSDLFPHFRALPILQDWFGLSKKTSTKPRDEH
jgi:hypothetical protein